MKLRYYAALVTGVLAMMITTTVMWLYTQETIGGILFWAVMVYMFSVGGTLAATEPKQKKPARKSAKKKADEYQLIEDPFDVSMLTLDREMWEQRRA